MPSLDSSLLSQLQNIANRYVLEKYGHSRAEYIDSGGSAAVYKINTPNGFRALKVCNPSLLNGDMGNAEKNRVSLQQRLIGNKSEFIVETYAIEISDTCIIEMEFLSWPSLKAVLKNIPDENIHSLISQLVQAIKQLEMLGLVHRDVKPENILISPDFSKLKLIDFGVIRDISSYDDNLDLTDHGVKKPFLATAQYSSPEYLFRLIEPSQNLWKGLTIYQVGAVLHDLLTKTPIFQDEIESGNRFVLAMAVLRKRPSLEAATNPELNQLKQLARNCLTKNLDIRLALIDWDDFEFSEDTALKRLRKQLNQRKQLSDIIGNEAIVTQRELSLKRYHILQALFESIRTSLIQELAPYIKIEAVSPKENTNFLDIKICFDKEFQDLWMKVSLMWDEENDSGTAAVYMQTRKDSQENANLWDGAALLIGTIDVSGTGQNELIMSLCEKLAAIIEQEISN